MGVLLDGLPAGLGRGRKVAQAAEALFVDIALNLQSIREETSSGAHLLPLNPGRFADVLQGDDRHELWESASVAQASLSDIGRRSAAGGAGDSGRDDEAVRRLATAARVFHQYLTAREIWVRAFKFVTAGAFGLLALVASVYLLLADTKPNIWRIAVATYVAAVIAMLLLVDLVAWIILKWKGRALDELYRPFNPYRVLATATMAGQQDSGRR